MESGAISKIYKLYVQFKKKIFDLIRFDLLEYEQILKISIVIDWRPQLWTQFSELWKLKFWYDLFCNMVRRHQSTIPDYPILKTRLTRHPINDVPFLCLWINTVILLSNIGSNFVDVMYGDHAHDSVWINYNYHWQVNENKFRWS